MYDNQPTSERIKLAGIDFWAVGHESFVKYIQLLDAFVTEPLLTGELLYGTDADYQRAHTLLRETTPTPEGIRFLLHRPFQAYLKASDILTTDAKNPRLFREFWSVLSSSISYWAFAREYATDWSQPLALTEVVERMPTNLQQLWKRVPLYKGIPEPVTEEPMREWTKVLLQNQAS